jgi:hypothetical protein
MAYYSEIEKIKDKFMPYLIDKTVIDVGCADHKVCEWAFGVDARPMEGVDLVTSNIYDLIGQLKYRRFDCLVSSHLIEHCESMYNAIVAWEKVIESKGYMLLYIPDANHYSHEGNDEHLNYTEYKSFMFWFKKVFCGEGKDFNGQFLPKIFEVVESGMDIGDDRYSFYLIAKLVN